MFIRAGADRQISFEERDNFRAFKIVVHADRSRIDEVRRALAGIAELPQADVAWVKIAALTTWPDVANDAQWQRDFAAMIEKARPHGWIDDQRQAIKAHVEWTA